RFEGYVSDSILESMRRLKEGVSLFVSFFSNYVKAATVWFDLYCELVRALGLENFLGILFKQVELEEILDPSKIDEGYLKFQIRSSLDLYLNEARFTLLSTYLEAKNLPKVVYYTGSEFAEKLIRVMEEQDKDWRRILNEIYSFYENTLMKGNLKEILEELKRIIGLFIDMAEKLRIAHDFIIPHKSWKNLLLDDIRWLGSRIEEIKEEILIITEYRRKYFEHGFNATMFLLGMLWGNNETAMRKFEEYSRARLSSEALIPDEIRLEALAFGLTGAREGFNFLGQAADVLKEKIHVLEEAAGVLGSQALKSLYQETLEIIKEHDPFWEKICDTLLTLQDLTTRMLNNE
ncbi:MAG: hypothetical protein ACTSWF_04220, partial [Candidatus Freyarchaeota archaeon]